MIEKKVERKDISPIEVVSKVDRIARGLGPESPGEGTNIVAVTWASNGESFAQQDPGINDVHAFGIFKSVDKNEYLIERGPDHYGVSEAAMQGTNLAEDSVAIRPDGAGDSLTSKGKRVWSQTSLNRGVINLGVVLLNVLYNDGAEHEAELLDRLHDMAADSHEEVYAEFCALSPGLDQLEYEISGQAVDTWIAAFKKRAELQLAAADRGEWSPPAVSFVCSVISVGEYRVTIPLENDAFYMLGLEAVPAPDSGFGYRDYTNTLVPLPQGNNAIGKEFNLESDNGKIGLRVLGGDYHFDTCGYWFTYYDLDLTKIKIKEPCPFAAVSAASPADRRMLRQVREFRDEYLSAFPRGQMYIDLYRAHSFEMWRMVTMDPEIRGKAKALLPQVVRMVRTWRDTEPARLERDTVDGLQALAELATQQGSLQLQRSIQKVMPDLEKFRGQSLGEILLTLEEIDSPKN